MSGESLSLFQRLYRGQANFDFMSRRIWWYIGSGVMLTLSVLVLVVNGLNLSIDFKGGTEFLVPNANLQQCDVTSAGDITRDIAGGEPKVQLLGGADIRVQTEELDEGQRRDAVEKLAAACGVESKDVTANFVGPSWGADVSGAALKGLIAFMVLVMIFLSVYFEWKMAVSALVALVHDLLVTVGIYALVGFEVTPSSVIGLLTVLGYSLYDTVVVFDKVKENTAGLLGGSRSTYTEATNAAVNQTLVRSINTSIVSILPVAAIFFIGAFTLGAGTLKDISLVLLIGLAAGTYSSIFLAAVLLAQLKEREPAMKALARRVAQRRGGGKAVPATASGATASTLTAGGTDFVDEAPAAKQTAGQAKGTGRTQPKRPQQRRPQGKRPR